jgi:galactokinase
MWGNTVAIHSVLKKKTTKLNSQPAQYEKNKIDKDNSRKKNKKTTWGNTVAIHSVLKKKTTKLNFQPVSY